MSIIKQEVAGLVGAYIRAWFYGMALGGALVAWLMMSQPADLSLQPTECPVTVTPQELPCMDAACLEAFGYTLRDMRQ
jgi:hypothetical protein